ncbi:MAG: ABC transporter permease, partial [Clostridiales bacterium]|nr:ABC transporter permease [Clostridiales bacterium]
MRRGLYPRLAFLSIRKNKKIYVPYILTVMAMVTMFFLVLFFSVDPEVATVKGGPVLQGSLSFGVIIITLFAMIFLFYTNSFLMRRRKKEFGLYNMLGMGKKNLAKILCWETVIMAFVSITGGILLGILFSKGGQLLLLKFFGGAASLTFHIHPDVITNTLVIFLVIFLLLLVHSLVQIKKLSPVELLQSESAGEKPPKANWIFAIAGVL